MAGKKKKAVGPVTDAPDTETGEIAFAPPALTSSAPKIELNGKTITLKKMVNRVLLRHGVGQTVYVKVQGPVRVGKEIKGSTMAPAKLVTVIEQTTGQEMDYIVSAVVEGLWTDNYPKNEFVGKSFAIYKEPKAPGKRYNNFSIAEVDVKG